MTGPIRAFIPAAVAVIFAAMLSACGVENGGSPPDLPLAEIDGLRADRMGDRVAEAEKPAGSQERVTVTGTYATRGDGVECPKIRTDGGELVGVSYVATDVPLGARVEISGYYVNMTTCRGPVVYAEQLRKL